MHAHNTESEVTHFSYFFFFQRISSSCSLSFSRLQPSEMRFLVMIFSLFNRENRRPELSFGLFSVIAFLRRFRERVLMAPIHRIEHEILCFFFCIVLICFLCVFNSRQIHSCFFTDCLTNWFRVHNVSAAHASLN